MHVEATAARVSCYNYRIGASIHLLPSQPPGLMTHVSELAVLTKTSTHCCGVPTRMEMADQVPSSPYLSQRQYAGAAVSMYRATYHVVDGVTLRADGVPEALRQRSVKKINRQESMRLEYMARALR